jgi:hypothetical protein
MVKYSELFDAETFLGYAEYTKSFVILVKQDSNLNLVSVLEDKVIEE